MFSHTMPYCSMRELTNRISSNCITLFYIPRDIIKTSYVLTTYVSTVSSIHQITHSSWSSILLSRIGWMKPRKVLWFYRIHGQMTGIPTPLTSPIYSPFLLLHKNKLPALNPTLSTGLVIFTFPTLCHNSIPCKTRPDLIFPYHLVTL